jgi:DNA repair protein RecO (recombination protein O)
MRNYKTEGIILKRKNLNEADRILTILSKDHGKISVKAPGVRRIPSRRSAHIELLNHTQITLYQSSKGFFSIVTEAQMLDDFSEVKNDLSKIGYAYYACELVNGLCAENQENRNVFLSLKNFLSNLCIDSSPLNLIKNFEKNLLHNLGFWHEADLLHLEDPKVIMERLLEKRLKTTRLLPLFASQ